MKAIRNVSSITHHCYHYFCLILILVFDPYFDLYLILIRDEPS